MQYAVHDYDALPALDSCYKCQN